MKKLLFALCALFVATISVAQSGLTCEDAIVLTKDYQATITGPCEVWYTATTYDLPIHVLFTPFGDNSAKGPSVELDFTCTPGVYDDPQIDSLVNNLVSDFIELPAKLESELVTGSGKNEWDLSMTKSYREQLAGFGILYAVRAYVKVTYHEAGTITLSPDSTYKKCMNSAQIVSLDDTIHVSANDEETVYVFPYTAWKNDSIRFVWEGDGQANVYVAEQECSFAADESNPYVFSTFAVAKGAPYKLYSEQMKSYISNHTGEGIFYAKVVAPSAGKLVVEKIPMAAAEGGAEMLVYGKSVQVKSSNQLYCFPRTWKATQFVAPQGNKIQMLVSTTADFTPLTTDVNVLATHDFAMVEGQRTLQLSSYEMGVITSQATGDYLYVRFLSDAPVQITPAEWVTSACLDKSYLITPNTEFAVAAKSSSKIFRARYADFSNYDLTIKWTGNSTLPTYIAETCDFSLSNTNAALLIKGFSISRKGTKVIDAATVDAWEPRIPEEGFFFVRFNPNNQGNVTFVTDKPEEVAPSTPDPVYTTLTDTVCYGVTYEWNDQKYTTSGEYSQTFTAANGADSVVTLTLVVLPEVKPVVTEQTIEYGKSFEWNNKVYTQSTTDTVTLQNEHGCDYLAILKLTVLDKPASPCVLKSIELKINDQLTLNLDSAFTIYRINYSEWVATGATLTWTGVEPLHTFVAETCEFAVAPYNKYVHAYVSVPAEGALAMTKAMLADMAEFVDEDGYLYVRFLTEQEGVLTMK